MHVKPTVAASGSHDAQCKGQSSGWPFLGNTMFKNKSVHIAKVEHASRLLSGKRNPEALVKESCPVAGQLPVEGPGRKLFDEMLQMISNSDGGVVPDWSGAPDLDSHTWWFSE